MAKTPTTRPRPRASAKKQADGSAPTKAAPPNTPAPWMPGYLRLNDLLGPLPSTYGENAEVFGAFLKELSDVVRPNNVIEEGLLRDVIFWSAQRDRFYRWRWELQQDLEAEGLRLVLPGVPEDRLKVLIAGCLRREPAALDEARSTLASLGLTFAHAGAAAAAARSDIADLSRATGECEDQYVKVWRRIDQSRSVRDHAHHYFDAANRRKAAAADKRRMAQVKAMKEAFARGVFTDKYNPDTHPSAGRRPTPEPAAPPSEVEVEVEEPITPYQPATHERPDWVAQLEGLKDNLPPLGRDAQGVDGAYLYHVYTVSAYPMDVLEQRFVRSAVQSRLENHDLQRSLTALVEVNFKKTLWETLRTLEPDVDHGPLLARLGRDSEAERALSARLAPVGMTLAQLEARGVLSAIKPLSKLQRRLIDVQDRSVDVDKAFEDKRATEWIRRKYTRAFRSGDG